jgi:flagellar biosynthesis protein FlhF
MIVKTYTARSIKEAIEKIKQDLGEDAVILSTKKVMKGSIFSFFKKEMFEVTAAIDNKPINKQTKQATSFKSVAHKYIPKDALQKTNKSSQTSELEDRIKRLEKLIISAGKENIQNVVKDIKHDLNDLKSAISYANKEQNIDLSKLPLGMHKYFTYMCSIGINKKYAYKLALATYNNIDKKRLQEDTYIKEYLSVIISQFFKLNRLSKKAMALVGPTGVGKTTTLAKLAAIYKLKLNKNIGIITTDTYRIGAVDQLLSYAKIMDIPAVVSITKDDFTNAMRDFSDMDNIFIDTVGRSPNDIKRLSEIFTLFNNAKDLNISLVLSMSTKETDCFDIYERFSRLYIDDFIFTKIDETNTPGTMLNMSVKLKKPVSYVSFGQDVPDDIMEAEPLKVSSLIIKGYKNG